MDKILEYTLREEDLESTAGGLVNLILKNCIRVTGHEISAAKFTPDGITADGAKVLVSQRLLPGQTLRVILREDEEAAGRILPVKSPSDLEILYEDEDLIVINKPAGVVVHPSPGHYADTLANYVAWYLKESGQGSACRIIGRLDKETSGAILFAKNRAGAARLTGERAVNSLKRTYIALVRGWFDESSGSIDAPLEKAPNVLMLRQVAKEGTGMKAFTVYRVLLQTYVDKEDGAGSVNPVKVSLLEVQIDTGRTHQIRVHMASIGHPLVGDTLYDGSYDPSQSRVVMPAQEEGREPVYSLKVSSMADGTGRRALLHAARLELVQPFTGTALDITAPLPSDFPPQCRDYSLRQVSAQGE